MSIAVKPGVDISSGDRNWKEGIVKVKTIQGDQSWIRDFSQLNPGARYLQLVKGKVSKHRGKIVQLSTGMPLRIGDLDDTVYWGRPDMLESWEELYLPERMEMLVLGTIDGLPCLAPGLQLVILAGKDGSVFAYEEELLYKIASSLQELFEKEVKIPGTEIYEYGKGFRPKTNEEYLAALKEAGLEKISQDTKDFVNRNASEMKELIDDLNFL